GSTLPIDRHKTAELLGMPEITHNSMDSISDRDFLCELAFDLSMIAMHLSRWAEQWILYVTTEFGFMKIADQFTTGSSMMPQKRNPDALEIARGSAARALGAMVSMFATSKGLPSGYNKDLQDDKRALFDSVDSLLLLLPAVTGSLRTLAFNRDRMATAVTSTMMATDLADYLVRRGATFRDAHGAVGRLVREAEEKGVELTALPPASFSAAHGLFGPDVMKELEPSTSVGHRSATGGTAPKAVIEQLAAARASLGL
ncbi:MAG TPA: argininosuccinate lyase, partial [Gemmatimonadaceae bacterium]|nr:argininosuccinate lyase [Gemmatimonadaceae bacterium]